MSRMQASLHTSKTPPARATSIVVITLSPSITRGRAVMDSGLHRLDSRKSFAESEHAHRPIATRWRPRNW
jgi:hypothetical protein